MKRWLSLAWLGALALGCTPPQVARQRGYAQELYPAELVPADPFHGPLRRLTLRVYADEAHQRAVLGWQVRFYRSVERANVLLRSRFGTELEIESALPWPRSNDLGGLESALDELARFDPGTDVDVVVGLTGPLAAVTTAIHELGMARVLEPQLVLRGMDDTEEARSFSENLELLDEDERQALYRARLRHKETVVLLHELGHSWGALHVHGEGAIMRPTLLSSARTFLEPAAVAMDLGLAARGPGRGDPALRQAAREGLAQLYRERRDLADAVTRARLAAWLAQGEGASALTDRGQGEAGEPKPERSEDPRALELPPPPPTPTELLVEAQQLAAKDLEAAWLLAEPIARAQPEDPFAQAVLCELAGRRQPKGDETKDQCQRAVELAPAGTQPQLMLAYVLSERDEVAAAEAVLDALSLRLEDPAEPPAPGTYGALAGLERGLFRISRAERAAQRMPEDPSAQGVLNSCREVRRLYQMQPGERAGALPEALEAPYCRAMGRFRRALQKLDLEAAGQALARMKRAFPQAAPHDELCRYLLERRDLVHARPPCRDAALQAPDNARAQLHLGLLELLSGHPGPAAKALEQAIARDPELKEAYRLLYSAEQARGNARGVARLDQAYRARFGRGIAGE